MLSVAQFWNGVAVLVQNYHAVNRKVVPAGLEVLKVSAWSDGADYLTSWTNQKDNALLHKACTEADLQSALEDISAVDRSCVVGFLIHSKLIPKKHTDPALAAVGRIDFATFSYTLQFCSIYDDFAVYFRKGEIAVDILSERGNFEESRRWAMYVLRPKLLKWCRAERTQKLRSLQLIDIEHFTNLYKSLKEKYANTCLEYWQQAQESTDPLKFIYEDLAIASYLIALWHRHNTAPVTFADLGCGNGLLVLVLNGEGYRGYGYDVRRRKIWSCYPTTTQRALCERSIEPHTFELPADVNFVIGNHSDELSPWVPVLAALSSYSTGYFLLPCCAYEFSGVKFQRRNSKLSVYQDFCVYANHISDKCGFVTLQDRLKIPSTKRIAFIGIRRTYADTSYAHKKKNILEFVSTETRRHANGLAEAVKLRDKQEAVHNCTQIDRGLIDNLVEKIFRLLLEATDCDASSTTAWRVGGQLTMREIVHSLSTDDLKHIKSECGGVKTLLRNKHEIFEFRGGDAIGIKKPCKRDSGESARPRTTKKRMCFFRAHHPNGCPLPDEHCTFIH